MTVASMSFSDILWLYRARLRARAVLVQECFAILGIAVGVALLFASQVASTSLTRSVSQLNSQIVGNTQFQLDARGPDGFDEGLLKAVRRVPGVQTALPVLEQQASVIGPRGVQRSVDLIGTDPRFAHFAGTLLRRFSAAQLAAQRAIALPAPIAAGIGAGALETIQLQIGASVVPTLLGATLGEADIGGLVHSPIALAPVGYAQRLAGMIGRITRIFVQAQPGREREVQAGLKRLAATVPVNVEPSDFDSQLFAVAVLPESQSEALFSTISALVGFMFALNAMLITVPLRRKLIDDIRPQGATRWMAVQILLFDAAVLGVLACILGLALGELLSIAVFHSTPGYLSWAVPGGEPPGVEKRGLALAIGAGMLAAVIGVLWPMRDFLAHPLAGTGSKSTQRASSRWSVTRLVAGLVCLGVTTPILLLSPQQAFLGSVTLIVALVCLLPLLFDLAVIAFERMQRLLNGAATILAVTELQTPPTRVRSLAVATTGAIAVFGIVAIQGAQVNLQRGLDRSARGIDSSAEVWVTPKGESNAFATTPFKDAGSGALARLPGVAALGLYRGSFLNWDKRRLWVLAQPSVTAQPVPPGQLLGGSLALASARVHQGGWAVLSQALASEHNLHIGQAFTLPSPRPISLRVAALSTNLGWPPGAIIMSSSDYAHAWESSDPSAYEIETRPGASPASVRRVLQRALGSETGLVVETSAEREQRHYALAAQGLSRLTQIRLLVLIAAVLAVAGALGAMIWQRRDLVAFIKCEGYRRGVLWRWLCCESALMLGTGCFIGAVFGLYGQVILSHALATATGFPISLNVEALVAVSSSALVSAVTVAVIALPGYLVVRVPPSTVSPAY
jgi:putative ABC transport system permease protein